MTASLAYWPRPPACRLAPRRIAAYCYRRAAVAIHAPYCYWGCGRRTGWPTHRLCFAFLVWPPGACVGGCRVAICFASVSYFFFNDSCQPLNLGFHWTDFHAVPLDTFGSAMAVDDQSEPRLFKGRCHGNQLLFFEILFFFAVTQNRREIGTWSVERKGRKFCLLSSGTIRNDLW